MRSRDLPSRDGSVITLYSCQNCTHNFQDPKNYQDIYSSGNFTRQARGSSNIPDTAKIKALDSKALIRLHFYRQLIADWHRVLEVGSSIGSFLHLLKIQGKEVNGIEPDPDYSTFSETQYNITQESVLLEQFEPSEKFDAVCSFHVIEHVGDPQSFVKQIHRLLEPNGKVLIECPSWEIHAFGSQKHTVWQPHIQYFTQASIYKLCSEYFKVLKVGFLGIALYIYAEKTHSPSYDHKIFEKLRSRSKMVFIWNKLIPRIRLNQGLLPLTTTQLLLQPLLQHTLSQTLNKTWVLGKFALKESVYRITEAGLKANRAVHLSYFRGWENAGDTVLSKCVRDSFREIRPQSWKLREVTAPVNQKLIREINNGGFLLIGGGGLLLPDSNPNSKSGWQWAASREDIDQIKVPIFIYAIGYNYFHGQEPERLFKESLAHIIRRSSFFSLRNHGSIRAVSHLVPPDLHHRIRFQPCPTTLIRHLTPSVPPKKSTKNIAINMAFDRYPKRFGPYIYVILDQLALALKAISKKGYRIFNICHLKEDAKFEISLDKHQVEYQTIQLQFALPGEVYRVYNNMDLVMGMRGHAQMIPFGLNCKIISLGSHNKLRYFLEDIDAIDWFIDLKTDPHHIKDRILELFDTIYHEKTATEERLIQQQRLLLATTRKNALEIEEILQTK